MRRSPEFVPGSVPEAGAGFGWEALQRLLDLGNFGTNQAGLRGVTGQALVAHSAAATGQVVRADVLAIEAGLGDGATFSINSVDDIDPWVRQRAEMWEDEVMLPVNVNCHVSLVGESALGLHADQHDVHALHTAGSKRWLVFGNGDEPGEQTHEFVTEAGDELFLPRGWWHLVHTVAPSIHLTFGVSWPTAARLAPELNGDDPLWQEPLTPDLPAGIRGRIEQSLSDATGRAPTGLIEALTEELRIHTPWRPRSDLLASVEPTGAIRIRRPRWCRVRHEDRNVVLEGSAMSVVLPAAAGPVIDALLNGHVLDAEAAGEITGGVVDAERFDQVASALRSAGLVERLSRTA